MRKEKFENGEYYHIYNRGVDKRDIFMDERDFLRFLKSLREFNRLDPIGSLVDLEERNHSESNSLGKVKMVKVNGNLQEGIGSLMYKGNHSESNSLGKVKMVKVNGNLQEGIGSLTPSAPQRLVDFIAYCLNPNHFHLLLRQLVDDGISKFMHKVSLGYTCYFNIKNKRSGSLFQGKFKSVKIDSEEDLLYVSAYINGNAQIHGLTDSAEESKWCSYSEYLGLVDADICNKNIILGKFKEISEFKMANEECIKQMKEKKDLQKYIID
ncbi:MAG: transposase [Candidatus Parcubacteria bacterium]|nr:transposase [Candidatus Parcubacteria bacterium]